ncbi:MAG: ASCH domain-containing protein [Candidatus Thiodiazotropha endolucinida]
MNDILISIRPNFVEKILDGKKTVELRTRRANLQPGTRMWIYSTLPQGEICAMAHVEFVHTDSPDSIWEQFRDEIGITEHEFWDYVGNRDSVSAIKLASVDPVESGVTLQYIQKKLGAFSPPQFFKRLKNDSPIHSLLCQAVW